MSELIEPIKTKLIHSGQKVRYGDSFTEYAVTSDMPIEDVEQACRNEFNCHLSKQQWRDEDKSMDAHFRSHYTIWSVGDGEYIFSICSPYAD